MLQIIPYRKLWFTLSGLLMLMSFIALIVWGVKPGIDFTGGSMLEIENIGQTQSHEDMRSKLNEFDLGTILVQSSGKDATILRFKEVDEDTHQRILKALETNELRFTSIGPSIGAELKDQAYYAIIVVVLAIIVYIGWAFRKVSWPIASWKYGVVAILTLVHDILITTGVFAFLGHFINVEIDTAFIVALLTILGYSVNDTIVIFDRIRENIPKKKGSFAQIVNISVNETLLRSLYTSLSTLLVLVAVYLFGGSSLQYFILTLLIGVVIGTYSSIFIASPLLVIWHRLAKKT